MKRGQKALVAVVGTTALVLTPLVLGGVYLGFYVGDAVGYSRTLLAVLFSTVGFVAGMLVIFRVIKFVVAGAEASR